MSRIAVIAGSGAAFFPLQSMEGVAERVVSTRWGAPSAPLQSWQESGHEVWLLRRHGEGGGIPPHAVNYRANIAALAELEVDAIIATNAVGGIGAEVSPGTMVIPDQLIDYSWGREHSFFAAEGDDPKYVEFTDPYTPALRASLLKAAEAAGIACIDGGVYGVTQGPRLETAAEINRLERDGCSLVGMTSMPEAGLACEAGLPYAACCSVVNVAAGRSDAPIHSEIELFLQQGIEQSAALVSQLIRSF